ncbi:MAG: hypothetical protein P4K94_00785 [Terracidiphilus sp.]|nr:hypothetical protein [Terracidiphilus sp.]
MYGNRDPASSFETVHPGGQFWEVAASPFAPCLETIRVRGLVNSPHLATKRVLAYPACGKYRLDSAQKVFNPEQFLPPKTKGTSRDGAPTPGAFSSLKRRAFAHASWPRLAVQCVFLPPHLSQFA